MKKINLKAVKLGIAGAAIATAVLTGAASCEGNHRRDVEGVPSHDPDWISLTSNVDEHPNIVELCANGLGFWTTTRDYTSAQRLPELDSFCQTVGSIGANGTRGKH